jgi:hypothetical protein
MMGSNRDAVDYKMDRRGSDSAIARGVEQRLHRQLYKIGCYGLQRQSTCSMERRH